MEGTLGGKPTNLIKNAYNTYIPKENSFATGLQGKKANLCAVIRSSKTPALVTR